MYVTDIIVFASYGNVTLSHLMDKISLIINSGLNMCFYSAFLVAIETLCCIFTPDRKMCGYLVTQLFIDATAELYSVHSPSVREWIPADNPYKQM